MIVPHPSHRNGSLDVTGKESPMTTPVPKLNQRPTPPSSLGWRDLIQSNSEHSAIEGFALEQIIDMQRDHVRHSGEAQ